MRRAQEHRLFQDRTYCGRPATKALNELVGEMDEEFPNEDVQRIAAQLLADVAAVDIHRLGRDRQVARDLLARFSGGQLMQHLALALRERRELLADAVALVGRRLARGRELDALL